MSYIPLNIGILYYIFCIIGILNYQSVSHLSFLSNIIEKVILRQLVLLLESNKCISEFQSAYCQSHSTETALCCIYNDLLANTHRARWLSWLRREIRLMR